MQEMITTFETRSSQSKTIWVMVLVFAGLTFGGSAIYRVMGGETIHIPLYFQAIIVLSALMSFAIGMATMSHIQTVCWDSDNELTPTSN
jgi:hypothetical protein